VGKAKAAYRVAKGLLIGKLFNKRVPVNVMWRITNRCNAKCSYCHIRKEKKKELTASQIFKIIDELDSLGCARIGFVGGEAFIRKDFEEIVDYVKSKGIYVTLVSNGILAPANMKIVRKLDCLVLSFDGRKETHDKGRMKGSFDKLMKTFDICKKNGINVLTNTVLNKYNLNDLEFVVKKAKEYGFNCTFNILQGGDYPNAEDYRKALRHLKILKESRAPIVLSSQTIQFLHDWPDYSKCTSKDFKGFKCWAGELIFNIDTDGKIAACDIMTHAKDNPSALASVRSAIEKVSKDGCQACTCAHVIEYNYMFSLSPKVIASWLKVVR
jgi:MoaA/NifB/PqqE/SkfB family radical SAM enzyme